MQIDSSKPSRFIDLGGTTRLDRREAGRRGDESKAVAEEAKAKAAPAGGVGRVVDRTV